jgi:hypothetical protein
MPEVYALKNDVEQLIQYYNRKEISLHTLKHARHLLRASATSINKLFLNDHLALDNPETLLIR